MSEKQDRVRRVVAAYKLVLGMQRDSERWRAWDKYQFARNAKAAVSVLAAFEDDVTRAVAWTIFKGNEWKEAGLSFTLETIARHGWDEGAIFDGRETGEMGDDNLLGHANTSKAPRSRVGVESAKEIMGNGFLQPAGSDLIAVPTKPLLGPENARRRAEKQVKGVQRPDISDLGEDLEPLADDA